MIKYIVYPGEISSTYDGEMHYVNASTLMRLYKVNMNECAIMGTPRVHGLRGTFIALHPQSYPDHYKIENCVTVEL